MTFPQAAATRRLKHRRQIDVQVFSRGDGLWEVDATLTDSKTRAAKMADGLKRVLTARGRVGAVGTQIEATRARLDAAQQEFTELRSNLADADMTQAVVDLQAAQNVYQASLASTARTFERSLMDYLR